MSNARKIANLGGTGTLPSTQVSGLGTLATKNSVAATELADLAVTTAKIADTAVSSAKIADTAVSSAKVDATVNVKLSGDVVQVVNTQTGAVATGTTIIPSDNTIPQNNEGTEFMTLAITPKSATNKLIIRVTAVVSNSAANNWLASALFQDSTADALACAPLFQATASASVTISYSYYMTAGTTSATTFKVRCGGHIAGTTTFNGTGGTRTYGGVSASSITITEIAA
jgi:hypothetical protein